MPKDLRTHLKSLDPEKGEVVYIDRPMQAKFEVSALVTNLARQGKYPVLVCNTPINCQGERTEYRLITNVMASRQGVARALGIDPQRIAAQFSALFTRLIDPVVVSRGEAPVKQVVYRGEAASLNLFPIVWHYEGNIGPYVPAGCVTTVDPESGVHNSAFQRCWVKTPNRMPAWISMPGHNWRNIVQWWARGEDAPIAVWAGHHPAAFAGAVSYGRIAGYPEDHYPHMGAALGEPLRLVASELFGDVLKVPADAEVIIEGVAPRNVYEAEGPFAERAGYTGAQRPNPVIEVRTITCRQDAFWHDITVATMDHYNLQGFAREAQVWDAVKRVVPEIVNVHASRSTGCSDHIYIQIKKVREGAGREAAQAALKCSSKHFFVFDDDIDIFDERQVMWAIATRSQWDNDLIVVPGERERKFERSLLGDVDLSEIELPESVVGGHTDPSIASPSAMQTRAALDCTLPAPPAPGMLSFFPEVNRIPAEALEAMRPEAVLPTNVLSAMRVE